MDIIISGNQEVLRMIKEIPMDASNKIDGETFRKLALEIAKGKEKDDT